MTIKIKQKHLALIESFGEEAYPNECCGFLLGINSNSQREVQLTVPTANSREKEKKYHRFLITPEQYLETEKFARERNMQIVGFYHSHPNAEARPSVYDLEHAWPWYCYIIISVYDSKTAEATAWTLQDDRKKFLKEAMIVVTSKEEK